MSPIPQPPVKGSVHDPKRGVLLAAGFDWVPDLGVWLHADAHKLASSRAVHDCSLLELVTFVRKENSRSAWRVLFSCAPQPGVHETLINLHASAK